MTGKSKNLKSKNLQKTGEKIQIKSLHKIPITKNPKMKKPSEH